MLDDDDDQLDPPYLVPTHLEEQQSIGPIPVRTFYVVLASVLLLGAPVATLGRRELGDIATELNKHIHRWSAENNMRPGLPMTGRSSLTATPLVSHCRIFAARFIWQVRS